MKELFVEREGAEVLTEACHRFFTSRITCQLSLVKSKGLRATETISVLLHLPFSGVSSMRGLMKSGCSRLNEAEKDVYYRLKNNPVFNWRHLSISFAKRFNKLSVKRGEAKQHTIKYFIVDDSGYHITWVKRWEETKKSPSTWREEGLGGFLFENG